MWEAAQGLCSAGSESRRVGSELEMRGSRQGVRLGPAGANPRRGEGVEVDFQGQGGQDGIGYWRVVIGDWGEGRGDEGT